MINGCGDIAEKPDKYFRNSFVRIGWTEMLQNLVSYLCTLDGKLTQFHALSLGSSEDFAPRAENG